MNLLCWLWRCLLRVRDSAGTHQTLPWRLDDEHIVEGLAATAQLFSERTQQPVLDTSFGVPFAVYIDAWERGLLDQHDRMRAGPLAGLRIRVKEEMEWTKE